MVMYICFFGDNSFSHYKFHYGLYGCHTAGGRLETSFLAGLALKAAAGLWVCQFQWIGLKEHL